MAQTKPIRSPDPPSGEAPFQVFLVTEEPREASTSVSLDRLEDFLEVSAVAEDLGVEPSLVRRWLISGVVPGVVWGQTGDGRLFVHPESVKRLKRHEEKLVRHERIKSLGASDSIDELYGILRRPGQRTVSIREMDEAIIEFHEAEDRRIREGRE